MRLWVAARDFGFDGDVLLMGHERRTQHPKAPESMKRGTGLVAADELVARARAVVPGREVAGVAGVAAAHARLVVDGAVLVSAKGPA